MRGLIPTTPHRKRQDLQQGRSHHRSVGGLPTAPQVGRCCERLGLCGELCQPAYNRPALEGLEWADPQHQTLIGKRGSQAMTS